MKLYSYCLKHDIGSAPNPYWGLCTLVICKPAIRRSAQIDDWLVGLGSAHSLLGDHSNCVIYAMRVTKKMSMADYNLFCAANYPNKIPAWRSPDYRRRVGDCIYDYTIGDEPKLRWGVHKEENRQRDLNGKYALISRHFYYFGDQPIQLPEDLLPIIQPTQGHKSNLNQPYARPFVDWLEGLGYRKNRLYGEPQLKAKYMRETDLNPNCSST